MKRQLSWRDYQESLQRSALRKRRLSRAGIGLAIFAVLAAFGHGLIGLPFIKKSDEGAPSQMPGRKSVAYPSDNLLDKKAVKAILENNAAVDATGKHFEFSTGNDDYIVTTTFDESLQDFIKRKIDTRTARYIGIVVTDPFTGKIIAMANYDRTDSAGVLCAENRFPAASVFKIITAAAVIERFDFNERKKIAYNGKKHTLYKSQLKNQNNRYTNWVTLKEAFATSINPVFGKLGALYLKKDILEQYAMEFGFNTAIDFELPLSMSEFTVRDNAYQWAEIASGFNRITKITPLHGALIAGTVINGGKLMEPFIIEAISNDEGRLVYAGSPRRVKQAISENTARIVQVLMSATINTGTCRKTFRGYGRDRVLSRLDMGGKTGSIDNASHDVRLDWFVGYARDKAGNGCIGASIFVAHEKYIGTRASQYAKIIFKHYFSDYFAGKKTSGGIPEASAKLS
ncbi:MAG: penicillin-binding transpeptidase domain-containing protein [Desulfobacterales bacterium]